MRSLLFTLACFISTQCFAIRDLSVGWNYSDIYVEWFELQWRNPTDWSQVTILNQGAGVRVLDTSLRYKMSSVTSGPLEIWCRSCRVKMAGEESACLSPMVLGWSGGCCSAWITLTVNEPSTPTKPVITP